MHTHEKPALAEIELPTPASPVAHFWAGETQYSIKIEGSTWTLHTPGHRRGMALCGEFGLNGDNYVIHDPSQGAIESGADWRKVVRELM